MFCGISAFIFVPMRTMKIKKTFLTTALSVSALSLLGIGIACVKPKPGTDTMADSRDSVLDAPYVLPPSDSLPPFLNAGDKWVDSVFNTLTADERLGQLFMTAVYSKSTTPSADAENLIKNYKIGGLIFMQGGPGRQIIQANHYQSLSKVPLMISIDGEWGLSMRLDSTMKFPWQQTLGAIQNDTLIYQMGLEIARQCKRIGVHINFAPVVDVNNNPKNPVINARSFGEDRENVSNKGIAYMKGLQDGKVLANAKHFPGHGDTDKDSHKSLPVINHSRERLDSIEMYPFRQLIRHGLGSVMVAHLSVPSLDNTANTPTTLSPKVVTDILKTELGFQGLIFTDALNMKGVSDTDIPGEVDARAVLAGNDVLLFSGDVPTAIAKIKALISSGKITQDELDARCKKILHAKYWMGLNKYKPATLDNLQSDLFTPEADVLVRRLTEASLTVLNNANELMPLKSLDTLKIASVAIGESAGNTFQARLKDYADVACFTATEENVSSLVSKLSGYNLVLISVHKSNDSPFKSYTISSPVRDFVKTVSSQRKTIVSVFANAYSLIGFSSAFTSDGLIMSYQNSTYAQDYTAQLIFGGIQAKGKLPVSIGSSYAAGAGIETSDAIRMKYSTPEDIGIKSGKLESIESIIEQAILDTFFPGCQILAAKNGVVFYQQSFGFHTYDKADSVKNSDLYDIASITKVTTSLPAVMRLVDEGKLELSKTFGDYLEETHGTDKENMVLLQQLTHQAGLKAWLPFHLRTIYKDKSWKTEYLSASYSENYPLKIADNLYAQKDFPDTMLAESVRTPLSSKKKYLYSDLGFYYIQRIVQNLTGESFNPYLRRTFYDKLGAYRLTYNPLEKFSRKEIVPTELDTLWRKQLVHGYVHDQGAALQGGVAGHAGIFASANDLAKMFMMYANDGTYGGERFIESSTIREFARCQFCPSNRRGIGWDKADAGGNSTGACSCVSTSSYGHAGFTGTLAWVDPANGLVYIFLSNRVHPNAENKKMIKSGTRAQIQRIFYEALK